MPVPVTTAVQVLVCCEVIEVGEQLALTATMVGVVVLLLPLLHADVSSRSLDQYIVKIRGLFKQHGLELDSLRTVHGVGFIFDPEGVSKEGK